MNAGSILFVVGVIALAAFALLCLIRAARRRFRLWRRYRREPIVLATEAQLAATDVEWPFHQDRWPSPDSDRGRDYGSEQLKAFARAARARGRLTSRVAELLGIIGGAALGVQIPGIVQGYESYIAASGKLGHLVYEHPFGALEVQYQDLLHLPPLLVVTSSAVLIFIANLLSDSRHDYDYIERAYLLRARQRGAIPSAHLWRARLRELVRAIRLR